MHRVAVLGVRTCLAIAAVAPSLATATTFTVSNDLDSGTGSLRQALTDANNNAGNDSVVFNLPGAGPHRIFVQTRLPTISDTLSIDGYSQPGALANTLSDTSNARIAISIEPVAGIATATPGLAVCASNVSIRGLAISGFPQAQLLVGGNNMGQTCTIAGPVLVAGNFLALRPDGSANVVSAAAGMQFNSGTVTVGGTVPADMNVVAASPTGGILPVNFVGGSRIDGNLIGTDPTGLLDRSFGPGISIGPSATNVSIGTQRANLLAFNLAAIRIAFAGNVGIRIGANRFVDNLQPIDLNNDGVTANDVDDVDGGANNGQNFPVLTLARRLAGGGLRVAGSLDRPAGAGALSFTVQVYASASCGANGQGIGERPLGAGAITLADNTAAGEQFQFDIAGLDPLPIGTQVSATVTNASNDTSEMSACIGVSEDPAALVVTSTADSGTGTLRAALLAANGNADANIIRFDIPGTGPHLIAPLSLLPVITAPVVIDGYSQPGSVPNSNPFISTAVLKVQLSGGGTLESGLAVCAQNVIVSGLAVLGYTTQQIAFGRDHASVVCGNTAGGRAWGNFIGLDTAGDSLGTLFPAIGVFVRGDAVEVGGEQRFQRNVIARVGSGVLVTASSGNVRIDGNLFGTAPNGSTPRPSTLGVNLQAGALNVRIGQRSANLFASNVTGLAGSSADGFANVWSGNQFVANSSLAVDLGAIGVTANDPDDADSGHNGLQNFPVLRAAYQFEGGLRVEGDLDVPLTAQDIRVTLSFYESAACDNSGNGEGAILLGSVDLPLRQGNESFAVKLAQIASVNRIVTATATTADGSSEFSSCVFVGNGDQVFRHAFE